MSYISDWLASDGSAEAYQTYKAEAQKEDARERAYIDDFERYADDEDLVIESEDDYE